ncbi:MAG: hypothetical protein Q9213_006352 [Squamulea squamosa]
MAPVYEQNGSVVSSLNMGAGLLARHNKPNSCITSVNSDGGFDLFPSEIIQEIAVYLPDKDLRAFALVQRTTCYAVIPANAGHWRYRFKDQYDLPKDKPPAAIKNDYIFRKCFLTHLVHFKYGHSPEEVACLEAIRQLIVEKPQDPVDSAALKPNEPSSRNVQQLWRFMKKSNLLFDVFRWTRSQESSINRLLEVIQVFFFGWHVWCATHQISAAYPLSLRLTAYFVEKSEAVAVALPSRDLVDAKGQIDFAVLSHLTNLWKFHLAINDDGELHRIFGWLPTEEQLMSFSRSLVPNKARLGMKWKGALCEQPIQFPEVAVVHPSRITRPAFPSFHAVNQVHTNPYLTGGDRLLDLEFASMRQCGPWPDPFEKEIKARSSSPGDIERPINPLECSRSNARPVSEDFNPVFVKATTTPKSGVEDCHSPVPRGMITDMAKSVGQSNGEPFSPRTKMERMEEKHFFGSGEFDVLLPPLNVAGIVQLLPLQCGVPGWQRFSMVSYETPPSGSAEKGFLDADEHHLCPFMRYEGVVLPGDSIIIGRYSLGDEYRNDDDPGQFLQRGTFIYWLSQDDAGESDKGDDAE